MISVRKYLRLLPAVVIVGFGVLAMKGVDIARAAQAVTNPDEPDNSGLAPTDNGSAPANKDYASDDGTIASAAEVDVLSSLTHRRAELDARERALAMRENLLSAGEGRVDQKIAALKTLQTQIQGLLVQRDDAQKAQIASLVKTYSTMKPKDAARIFNTLSDDVLLPVAKGMKSDVLAPVIAAMNSDAAQKLTVKLANLLKLPEPACTDSATAPAPGTSADLTSPVGPLQTAALSPPGVTPVVSPLPQPTPAQTPPAPAPAATTPPAVTPAATPPVQAAAPPPKPVPPKPHVTPVAHPTIAKLAVSKPTTAATAPVTGKPTTATAPAPTKPTAAAATPPAKPETAAVTPPAKPVGAPGTSTPVPPASTPPASAPAAKPQAASGPPVSLTPAPGG